MYGNIRTPKECIATVVHAVQRYIDKGVCQCCAITLVGHDLRMARHSVEDVWVDHNVGMLD